MLSIIIPCRNEKRFIRETITTIFNQKKIDDQFEVLVVDGMSDDGTREILFDLQKSYNSLRIIDNPQKITPVALNLGVKNASGELILILGAHSEFGEDFICNSLQLIRDHPEAVCIGGPLIHEGQNNFAKAVAISMTSMIGVGNAAHRFPDFEGYAEMACFPLYRKEVFTKYGYFDERLIRNQDDEFAFRLTKNNEKIFLSNKVKAKYFVRDSVKKLFSQYFDYGYWKAAVLKIHKIPISFRHLVPAVFFSLIILLVIISFLINPKYWFIGILLPGIYLLSLVIYSLSSIKKSGFNVAKFLPISILIMHFSYACGFVSGIIDFFIKKKFN
ncbi:MAG: glycosyltransferase family 2 protein [Ignavibacteriaceae bacterium]|nr:glycosyltransferase family 2 protein [Ignavibacteriaceae bacterium]